MQTRDTHVFLGYQMSIYNFGRHENAFDPFDTTHVSDTIRHAVIIYWPRSIAPVRCYPDRQAVARNIAAEAEKRPSWSGLRRDISLTNAYARVMELTSRITKLSRRALELPASCRLRVWVGTSCQDKSVACPYDFVSEICMSMHEHARRKMSVPVLPRYFRSLFRTLTLDQLLIVGIVDEGIIRKLFSDMYMGKGEIIMF